MRTHAWQLTIFLTKWCVGGWVYAYRGRLVGYLTYTWIINIHNRISSLAG